MFDYKKTFHFDLRREKNLLLLFQVQQLQAEEQDVKAFSSVYIK